MKCESNFRKGDYAYLACDFEDIKRFQQVIIESVFTDHEGVDISFRQIGSEVIYTVSNHVTDILLDYSSYMDERLRDDLHQSEKKEIRAAYENMIQSYYGGGAAVMDAKKNTTPNKSATVLDKKASLLLAELALKNNEKVVEILRNEEFKLYKFSKDVIQQIIDVVLDEKDYKLLKKLYL